MYKFIRETRSRVIIIALVAVIAGLTLLLFLAFFQDSTWFPSWLQVIIEELVGILLISGVIAILSEYFVRRDFLDEIGKTEERLRYSMLTSDGLQRLGSTGIIDCYHEASKFDFDGFISNAQHLTISLNDGRTWISANLPSLEAHMSKGETTTTLILADPEGPYAPLLAEKTKIQRSYLSEKIKDTCRKAIDAYVSAGNQAGDLKIYWHSFPVVLAIYSTEINAVFTPYSTSPPRAEVPLFVCCMLKGNKKTCFEFIRKDLETLLRDEHSRLVFHAKQGKVIYHVEELGHPDLA